MQYSPIPRKDGDFQRPVTAGQIQAMCQRALGDEALQAREFGTGMFNNTFLVSLKSQTDPVVLRVGADPSVFIFRHEQHLLRREYSVQPYLTGVQSWVPRTLAVDFTQAILPRDYMFQTCLPGDVWDDVKDQLSQEEHDVLWEQLGTLTRQIHQTHGGSFGMPYPKPGFSRWSEALLYIGEIMYADLVDLKLETEPAAELLACLKNGTAVLDEIEKPALLHGDPWPKNVMIKRREGDLPVVTGLIDSERALWGDPLYEWIFYLVPMSDTFWKTYGPRPNSAADQFRQSAYLGLWCTQMFLEAWRFGWEKGWIYEGMNKAINGMKQTVRGG